MDNDPRVFFAAERTLLAWVRTGIAVMALGFVVERFGFFMALVAQQVGAVTRPMHTTASSVIGTLLTPDDAQRLGLVTATPDDLDWDDELRITLEERASMSPDALTGRESKRRFGGTERMEKRILDRRLSRRWG